MSKLESIMTLIQTVVASTLFYITTLGFLVDKSYLPLLQVLLGLLILIIAFNNKVFYKTKYTTPICCIFGIALVLGVLI